MNWSPRTSLIASRLTTEASKILATLCPMVLCPENDRPHRTISIAEEFTLRRYPISGAPVDPRTAARLRILGSGVAVRVEGDDGSAELAPAEDTLRHKVLKVVIEAPTIVHFEMRLEKPGS